MRHLVIGDSHLAALKLAWNAVADDHPGVEIVFAGARGRQVHTLHVRDAALTSTSASTRQLIHSLAGTTDAIDVTAFDRCWIVGVEIGARGLIELYVGYRCERHPDLGPDNVQVLSNEAFDLCAESVLRMTAGERLATEVRAAGTPVGLVPRPMPSHTALASRRGWASVDDPLLMQEIASRFATELAAIGHRVGASVHPQPESTLQSPVTTRSAFARNSFGLLRDEPHAADDPFHMNADYGRLVMAEHILVGCA